MLKFQKDILFVYFLYGHYLCTQVYTCTVSLHLYDFKGIFFPLWHTKLEISQLWFIAQAMIDPQIIILVYFCKFVLIS